MSDSPDDKGPAPFAYEGLDRVIHEKARLGIMTSLATNPNGLSFSDLKDLCGLTDGNLNRHLDTLQKADLVALGKTQRRGRSVTTCVLTPGGRERFLAYLAELERVVADAEAAVRQGDGVSLDAPDAKRFSPA